MYLNIYAVIMGVGIMALRENLRCDMFVKNNTSCLVTILCHWDILGEPCSARDWSLQATNRIIAHTNGTDLLVSICNRSPPTWLSYLSPGTHITIRGGRNTSMKPNGCPGLQDSGTVATLFQRAACHWRQRPSWNSVRSFCHRKIISCT